jgi:cytochrome P450
LRTRLSLSDVVLNDPDVFVRGEHHEMFEVLRREAPVWWQERSWGPGFWNVTKYEDLIRVSRDPSLFISGKGIVIDNDGERTKLEQAAMPEQQFAGQMMIMTDPPRHTLMRQAVNKEFTPRAVQRLEPHIREIVRRLIDEAASKGECDFVADVSKKLPLAVICEMVGVPDGDWERMFELSNAIIGFDDPDYRIDREAFAQQDDAAFSMDMFTYFMGLCNGRRAQPRDDLLSALVHAKIGGEQMMDHEIFFFFVLLIVAGNETTRNATTGGMLALIENPDQLRALAAEPSLVPSAVEEIVRWVSPVMHFYRTATRETEIRGQRIAEGDQVCMWYPSVNRDEDVFGDTSMKFDVRRSPNEHLAFGIGEHFCLGANLARLELNVMFEEIVRRVREPELAGDVVRLRSNFIGGIKRMPIRFKPS